MASSSNDGKVNKSKMDYSLSLEQRATFVQSYSLYSALGI